MYKSGFYFCNTPIPEKKGSCMEVRLNSPHSKFGDIPGASFSEEEIGKLTTAG